MLIGILTACAAGVGLIFFAPALLLGAALASGPEDVSEATFPSATRELAVVGKVRMGGGAAGYVVTDVFLRAGARDSLITRFNHAREPFRATWLSSETVAICSPDLSRSDFAEKRLTIGRTSVLVKNDCSLSGRSA